MSASFSQEAWERVAPVHRSILEHPFVSGLGDGTLPAAVFERYLRDDAHYLLEYARALALIAARMPTAEGVGVMARSAAGAVEAERELHRTLLGDAALGSGTASPACEAYTGFLLARAATAPVEVALGAVLPCFRVYAEVGAELVRRAGGVTDHPYAAWLSTYSDPAFAEAVLAVEALADELGARSAHRADALAAYEQATRHEWHFWDQSWRGWDEALSDASR